MTADERLRDVEARLAAALAAEKELRSAYALLLADCERDEKRHADILAAVRGRADATKTQGSSKRTHANTTTTSDATTGAHTGGAVSELTSNLRTVEGLAIDAREQLALVLVDVFEREHATSEGALVLDEPLSLESVAALRQIAGDLLEILRNTRIVLHSFGIKADLGDKFAASDAIATDERDEKAASAA